MEPLGSRPLDEQFDFTAARKVYTREVKYYTTFLDFVKSTSPFRKFNHVANMKTLNPDQKACMNMLQASIKRTVKHDYSVNIIDGPAGCGKTLLLSQLCVQMDMAGINYHTCAFTGVSAKQFNSFTIFGLLGIYNIHARHDEMVTMRVWNSTKDRLKNIAAVVIDESYLCSSKTFSMMVERINYIKGNKTDKLPCSFYLFGDRHQLSPVGAHMLCAEIRPHFDSLTIQGLKLYQAAEYRYELTTVMRQREDPGFQHILSHILTKEVSKDDLAKLEARRDINLSEEEQLFFKNVIHLFATNQQCYDHAYTYIYNSNIPVRKINTQFSYACHECKLEYLPIFLGVGTQVFLTRNKVVSRGLVNGSVGHVTNIYYSEDNLDIPVFIAVKFEGYTGLTIKNFSVPIALQHDKIFCPHSRQIITVSYFPLKPAISRSIHKAQSATYEHVVVNLDNCSSYDRKIYTAISRCTKLQNLMLTYTKPLHTFFKNYSDTSVV